MKSMHPFVAAGVVLLAVVHVLDPPVIGTVNLERVFHDIQARQLAEGVLQSDIEIYETRKLELRAEAKRLDADLEMLVPGTKRYDAVQKQQMQAALDFRAMGEFIQYKLDTTRAEARRKLFDEIIGEAAKYAAANGIDFLLTDDSKLSLQSGTDMQIVQQLALRRIIYANDAYDITDKLIDWINGP